MIGLDAILNIGGKPERVEKAITAIKEALAQSEQDGECKYCTHGCTACDARRQSNVLS
jgi:hypothetical protein